MDTDIEHKPEDCTDVCLWFELMLKDRISYTTWLHTNKLPYYVRLNIVFKIKIFLQFITVHRPTDKSVLPDTKGCFTTSLQES